MIFMGNIAMSGVKLFINIMTAIVKASFKYWYDDHISLLLNTFYILGTHEFTSLFPTLSSEALLVSPSLQKMCETLASQTQHISNNCTDNLGHFV